MTTKRGIDEAVAAAQKLRMDGALEVEVVYGEVSLKAKFAPLPPKRGDVVMVNKKVSDPWNP